MEESPVFSSDLCCGEGSSVQAAAARPARLPLFVLRFGGDPLLAWRLRFFLSREGAFLTAAQTAMRAHSLEQKFCRGDEVLGRIRSFHVQRRELLNEALNLPQFVEGSFR